MPYLGTDISPRYDKLTNGRAVLPYLGTDISPRYDKLTNGRAVCPYLGTVSHLGMIN